MRNLVSLHVYPLKSARGIDPTEAVVEPWGLAGDRRWMLVDTTGRFVSQRKQPRLATVTVCPRTDGSLVVNAPSMDEFVVAPGSGRHPTPVNVWDSEFDADLADDDAHAWFATLLDTDVRLVHLDDPTRRAVDPRYGSASDRVSFADGFPLLLTTTGSLEALNALIGSPRSGESASSSGPERASRSPLPMNRFRPNVVIDERTAWAEDRWRRVRIGDVVFRVVKPCSRCVITTTDQRTGERGPEPLRALGRHRRFGKRLLFGQNLIPDLAPGGRHVLRVGDEFEVLETGDPHEGEDRPAQAGHPHG